MHFISSDSPDRMSYLFGAILQLRKGRKPLGSLICCHQYISEVLEGWKRMCNFVLSNLDLVTHCRLNTTAQSLMLPEHDSFSRKKSIILQYSPCST